MLCTDSIRKKYVLAQHGRLGYRQKEVEYLVNDALIKNFYERLENNEITNQAFLLGVSYRIYPQHDINREVRQQNLPALPPPPPPAPPIDDNSDDDFIIDEANIRLPDIQGRGRAREGGRGRAIGEGRGRARRGGRGRARRGGRGRARGEGRVRARGEGRGRGRAGNGNEVPPGNAIGGNAQVDENRDDLPAIDYINIPNPNPEIEVHLQENGDEILIPEQVEMEVNEFPQVGQQNQNRGLFHGPCVICMEEDIANVVISPCWHVCACQRCWALWTAGANGNRCPICRAVYQHVFSLVNVG